MMRRNEFEKLTAESFEQLPQWVREKIKNVALLVDDKPSPEVRRRERLGRNHTLLGYYQGIPLSVRGEHYGVGPTMPDTITLYQIPIEETAADKLGLHDLDLRNPNLGSRNPKYREILKQIIAETIWHEFAHHFGMGEKAVRDRERQKRSGQRRKPIV